MQNFYVRMMIVILIVIALAQFIPEAVNWFLLLVLASMLVMNAAQFSKLIGALNLKT